MRYLIILLLVLTMLLGYASPAFAITPPDILSIPDVKVFRNLAEPGDVLYVFEYQLTTSNGSYSTTPASDSWMFRLYDADGVTLKGSTSPYVYSYFESSGYDLGVSSFYFSASDNASTWGSAVTIELYGTPAYYSPALTKTYTLTTNDYTTANTTVENQGELAAFIFLLCDRLTTNYQALSIVLKGSTDSGDILSSYGEMYFRGAIPGIQSLCPELFYIQVYVPVPMTDNVSYNMTMGTTYGGRLTATDDIREGFDNLGDVIGVGGGFAAAGVCMVGCFGLCFWTTRKGWGTEIGLIASAIIGTAFALIIGDILFTILMVAGLAAGMGLSYLFIFKRA